MGVNFKDITPVMMACVPVMHFQEQVLGKSVSALWDLLKAAKIAPKDLKFDHYMQVQAGKDFDKSECIKQKGTKSTKVKVSVKHKRILQSVAPKKTDKKAKEKVSVKAKKPKAKVTVKKPTVKAKVSVKKPTVKVNVKKAAKDTKKAVKK